MRGLVVLGSTGSVGVSTLDVVERNPGRFRVVALTGNRNVDLLAAQCEVHRPALAVVGDEAVARVLRERVPHGTRVLSGVDGLREAAAHPEAEMVMAAIVGAAGLLPTLAAAEAGKRVLLANKESVVMAGELLLRTLEAAGGSLIPIDSEHNALFQCLPAGAAADVDRAGVDRLILTASGGPFLDTPLDALDAVTPAQACRHPNWEMGRKISVDSATMMNKGLEVIEACRLFGVGPGKVSVIVHPPSIVHSLVQYRDGSVLAQLGNPDMRTPIAHALGWPERIDSGVAALDLAAVGSLDFRAPEPERFPCLALAMEAARSGAGAAVALSAANEMAVAAFLDGKIRFTGIAPVIDSVLAEYADSAPGDLDDILALDGEARRLAGEKIRAAAL